MSDCNTCANRYIRLIGYPPTEREHCKALAMKRARDTYRQPICMGRKYKAAPSLDQSTIVHQGQGSIVFPLEDYV